MFMSLFLATNTSYGVSILLYGIGGGIVTVLVLLLMCANSMSRPPSRPVPDIETLPVPPPPVPPQPYHVFFAEPRPGTVCAIAVDPITNLFVVDSNTGRYVGMGSVENYPNAPSVPIDVSQDFLRERCYIIPEAHARLIHPALFGNDLWLNGAPRIKGMEESSGYTYSPPETPPQTRGAAFEWVIVASLVVVIIAGVIYLGYNYVPRNQISPVVVWAKNNDAALSDFRIDLAYISSNQDRKNLPRLLDTCSSWRSDVFKYQGLPPIPDADTDAHFRAMLYASLAASSHCLDRGRAGDATLFTDMGPEMQTAKTELDATYERLRVLGVSI